MHEFKNSELWYQLQDLKNKNYSSTLPQYLTTTCAMISRVVFIKVYRENLNGADVRINILNQTVLSNVSDLEQENINNGIYNSRGFEKLMKHFKIKLSEESKRLIDEQGECLNRLVREPSPYLLQMMTYFNENVPYILAQEKEVSQMDKLIKLMNEEINFCNAYLPSSEMSASQFLDFLKSSSPKVVGKVKEKSDVVVVNNTILAEKVLPPQEVTPVVEEIAIEVKPELCNLNKLLSYSNGAGITRMLGQLEGTKLLKHKPYEALPFHVIVEILNAILPVAPSSKIKQIKTLIAQYS